MAKSEVRCDVAGIMARIEQVGERATKGVSGLMRDYGEIIAHQAIMNAPRDTGSLESAIKVEYNRNGINGRLVVRVFIDTSTANFKNEAKTVGEYAWKMEQGLSPHGDGDYQARGKTLAKGPQAGGRFMQRAVKEHEDAFIEKALSLIKRSIR